MITDFVSDFITMMSFTFMQRALVVGFIVSLCASLLGVSLVLKRYAMIGHGLSYVGFAAMAAGTGLGLAPFTLSLPVVIVAAFLLLRLDESNKIKGDSAVAMIAASSLAIGVIIKSRTTGLSIHVCSAMFGSILAMSRTDTQISIGLSIVVMALFVLFYKQLFAVTYDEEFARAAGTNTQRYKSLLAFLTAVTVVLGMRMMGALLIASLLIFPALTAMRICKSFLSVVITSVVVAVASFLVGFILSAGLDFPTGASVVVVNLVVFAGVNIAALILRRN